jgi:hypothetical protein
MLLYKTKRFAQHVYYAETNDEMEKLGEQLLKRLTTSKKPATLGFDTEMVDTRTQRLYAVDRGVHFAPTVMIQLATQDMVALFHFHAYLATGVDGDCARVRTPIALPRTLERILKNESIVKVGVATHHDTEGIARTFGLSGVAQLIDMRALGLNFGLPFNSLRDVAAWYGRRDIVKGDQHDWCVSLQEGSVRVDEIEYAALDAIVCFEANRRLAGMLPAPDATTMDTPGDVSTLAQVTGRGGADAGIVVL